MPGPLRWDNASWFLRQTLGVDIVVSECAAAAQHRRHIPSDRFVVRPKLEEEGPQGWRKWQLHLFSFFLPGFLLWLVSDSHWATLEWPVLEKSQSSLMNYVQVYSLTILMPTRAMTPFSWEIGKNWFLPETPRFCQRHGGFDGVLPVFSGCRRVSYFSLVYQLFWDMYF